HEGKHIDTGFAGGGLTLLAGPDVLGFNLHAWNYSSRAVLYHSKNLRGFSALRQNASCCREETEHKTNSRRPHVEITSVASVYTQPRCGVRLLSEALAECAARGAGFQAGHARIRAGIL